MEAINSITGGVSGLGSMGGLNNAGGNPLVRQLQNKLDQLGNADPAQGPQQAAPAAPTGPLSRPSSVSFGDVMTKFVDRVDQSSKNAAAQMQDVMLGRSDNLHQAVVASSEADVSFTLMLEMRNKLVESYQELMRMQV